MNYYFGVKIDIVITLAIKESVCSPPSASGPLPVAEERPQHHRHHPPHHYPGPGSEPAAQSYQLLRHVG